MRAYYWLFLYLPLIRENLLLGYGPFLPIVNAKSDDSQFVLFLLRGGLITLVGWIAVMWGIVRWASRPRAPGGDVEAVLRPAVLVMTLGLVVASVMQSFFTYTGVVEFYWVVVGLRAARESRTVETGTIAVQPGG